MHENWFDETRCQRCGRCCHEKFALEGVIILSDIPCRYLDPQTHLCRIYADRLRINPRCQTAEASFRAGGLPANCPYVAGCPDYVPPVDVRDNPRYADLLAAIKQKYQSG
ncbi:MAG: hypothetical protein N3A66_05545 [Planctomycetota bacterium]|nr:hypothetical protein [Planctomycetota bacterium]